jgi:hypothetical protein
MLIYLQGKSTNDTGEHNYALACTGVFPPLLIAGFGVEIRGIAGGLRLHSWLLSFFLYLVGAVAPPIESPVLNSSNEFEAGSDHDEDTSLIDEGMHIFHSFTAYHRWWLTVAQIPNV